MKEKQNKFGFKNGYKPVCFVCAHELQNEERSANQTL